MSSNKGSVLQRIRTHALSIRSGLSPTSPTSPPPFNPKDPKHSRISPPPPQFAHISHTRWKEGEHYKHVIVEEFIKQAYPRSPDAVPKNARWDVDVLLREVEFFAGWRGSRPQSHTEQHISMEGCVIFARGQGVWESLGLSRSLVDNRGARLWAALPATQPARFVTESQLIRASWTYVATLREATCTYYDVGSSQLRKEQFRAASVWRCTPVGTSVSSTSASNPGLTVCFILENDKDRRGIRGKEFRELIARPFAPPGRAVGIEPAHIALIQELLRVLDADQLPATYGWRAEWRTAGRSLGRYKYIAIIGANVLQRAEIQLIRLMFYGLPEESLPEQGSTGHAVAPHLELAWHQDARDWEAEVDMRFKPELKLCDPATDRVVRTVWEVKAIDGSRESLKRAALPRRTELWFTNE